MARLIQVIEVEIRRGKGVENDVIRGVMQYWSPDGELLAENDPCAKDKMQTRLGDASCPG